VQRKSLVGHPDAIQFLQISGKRVFQQPRLISTATVKKAKGAGFADASLRGRNVKSNKMHGSSRTPGEVAFEKYLVFHHIKFEFEKEHPGKSKRPDYTVEWEGKTIVFDVKDFDPPKIFSMGFGLMCGSMMT
jgi:hypothetical protein